MKNKKPIKTKSKSRFLESEYRTMPEDSSPITYGTLKEFEDVFKDKISKCKFCGILSWDFGKQRCKCDLI